MAAKFVAAIDHGTTSTRCILFDELGAPIAIAQRGQTMHYPRPGWVELDLEEVWNRTQECIHETLRSAGAAPADVAGIGITNERESVVLWDRRTGRPVARSIVWQVPPTPLAWRPDSGRASTTCARTTRSRAAGSPRWTRTSVPGVSRRGVAASIGRWV
jgi:glycerol kinase